MFLYATYITLDEFISSLDPKCKVPVQDSHKSYSYRPYIKKTHKNGRRFWHRVFFIDGPNDMNDPVNQKIVSEMRDSAWREYNPCRCYLDNGSFAIDDESFYDDEIPQSVGAEANEGYVHV